MRLQMLAFLSGKFLAQLGEFSRQLLTQRKPRLSVFVQECSDSAVPLAGIHVHIVCYEHLDSWILGKMSKKLYENSLARGVNCTLGNEPDPNAHINHHICYVNYNAVATSLNTTMITHVDAPVVGELELIREQMQTLDMGICLSSYTLRYLVERKIPMSKLCFINPAHDGDLYPRRIKIGIFSRLYSDGRKREQMLVDLTRKISPSDFAFSIMGSGWSEIVIDLRQRGFQVDYREEFSRAHYEEMLQTIDHYLYFGLDEGSMGFIDALSCGISTIVTNQGFHLDATEGAEYTFSDISQLESIFEQIVSPKKRREKSVAHWTWENYANKHIEVWEKVAAGKISRVKS